MRFNSSRSYKYIAESLNRAVPFEDRTKKNPPEAKFDIEITNNGKQLKLEYLVEFFPSDTKKDHYDFVFSLISTGDEELDTDPDKVSRAHNFEDKSIAFKVFATLAKIFKTFIINRNPDSFEFSANIEEKSRIRLYLALTKRIEKFFGYEKYKETNSVNNSNIPVVTFHFRRKKSERVDERFVTEALNVEKLAQKLTTYATNFFNVRMEDVGGKQSISKDFNAKEDEDDELARHFNIKAIKKYEDSDAWELELKEIFERNVTVYLPTTTDRPEMIMKVFAHVIETIQEVVDTVSPKQIYFRIPSGNHFAVNLFDFLADQIKKRLGYDIEAKGSDMLKTYTLYIKRELDK
jgi:hypothetical protein